MKDATPRLACKPEHAVDLDAGAVLAADDAPPADEGDTPALAGTLETAENSLAAVGERPTTATPAGCVADKGWFSREVLKALDAGPRTGRPPLKRAAAA